MDSSGECPPGRRPGVPAKGEEGEVYEPCRDLLVIDISCIQGAQWLPPGCRTSSSIPSKPQ